MKWAFVVALAGLFASLEDWTLKIGLVLGFAAAVVAFWRQVLSPVVRSILTAVSEVRGMVETVEGVPAQLDAMSERHARNEESIRGISDRLEAGDRHFDSLHAEQQAQRGVLEVLADHERQVLLGRIYTELPERRTPMDRRETPPAS